MKARNCAFGRFVFSALAGAILALQTSVGAAESTNSAEAGKPAPDFTLKNIDGKSFSLSSFRNKIVVLEWFDDQCPFDRKHYDSGNMQSLQKEYGKKGVVWLLINSSGPGKHGFRTAVEYKEIMKSWKFATPLFLQDPDGVVGHLYGAKTTPDMYVVAKNGTLAYCGAIDDQPDTDIESIKGAKNYVRQALDQVLDGKPVTTSSTKPYG